MKTLVLFGLLFAATASAATSPKPLQPPAQTKFQTRYAIALEKGAAYYALELPADFYSYSVHGRDLRVFNAAGEQVPYTLESPHPVVEAPPPEIESVPWFPLPEKQKSEPQITGFSIGSDGHLTAQKNSVSSTQRAGDMVDASRIGKDRLRALLLHIDDDNYQGEVEVWLSNDLQRWVRTTSTPLFNLRYQDQRLAQQRIEIASPARYVQLRWQNTPPTLTRIDAELARAQSHITPAETRLWREPLSPHTDPQSPGTYFFDTSGPYPVDRLRIRLPEINTIVRATLSSRRDTSQPWRHIDSTTLYRLHGEHHESENPPLTVAPNRDHLWKLQIDTRHGGLGQNLPTLSIGWRSETLTFLARGEPPFSLAVGNNTLADSSLPRRDLLIDHNAIIASAQLTEKLPALVSPTLPPAEDSRKNLRLYVLWAILLVTVAFLGGMAWKLAKRVPEKHDA